MANPDRQFTNGGKLLMGLSGTTLIVASQNHNTKSSRGTTQDPLKYYFFDYDDATDAAKGNWRKNMRKVSQLQFKINADDGLVIQDWDGKQHTLASGTALTGIKWAEKLSKGKLMFAFTGTDSAGNAEQLVVHDPGVGRKGVAYGFNLA